MVNGLLVTICFIYCFLWMSGANEVEQFRPDWLACNELGDERPQVVSTLSKEI